MERAEILRYIINGLIATLVHFSVLTFNVEVVALNSAGVSNFIAALFGISTSFLGSRYYVFQKHHAPVLGQAALFVLLYGFIAMLHGLILLLLTDIYGYDYRIGFVIATLLQVSISYASNKYLVFKQ
jgi:putative flippase GtrA